MILPRLARAGLIAAAAVAVTGCATFTENDVVARVGDDELTNDEFAERVDQLQSAQGGATGADRIDGELARSTVANWLALRLAAQAGVVERYGEGVDELGVACVFALPAADEAAAQAIVDELTAGADWDEVIAREAPDIPGAGRQQCISTQGLSPDLAAQIAGMSPADPYRVVTGQGLLVIRAQTEAELFGIDLLTALQPSDPALIDAIVTSIDGDDVYVDPRVGTFVAERFAVEPVS